VRANKGGSGRVRSHRPQPSHLLFPAACVASAMMLAACAPSASSPTARLASAPSSVPATVGPVAAVAAGRPLTLPYREFALRGSFQLASYTERYALLSRNTGLEFPSAELHLLDLRSGRTLPLLKSPVNAAGRFDISGSGLSDEAVAWEEVSPGEGDDPAHASWRLFVSRLDPARGLVGGAVLVDASDAGRRSRPLFGMDGTKVVWMTSEQSVAGGRITSRSHGRLSTFDVVTTRRTELASDAVGFTTLSLSEGVALAGRPGQLLQVPISGAAHVTTTPIPAGEPSHFPAAHAGWVSWAAFNGDTEWPDLFVRRPGSATMLLAREALDPVFAGHWLFFESNEASPAAGAHAAAHEGSIWAIALDGQKKQELLRTQVTDAGWWQTALGQGRTTSVFVVFNDLTAWKGGTDRRTLVRVYRL
jgi:hypothetical protein